MHTTKDRCHPIGTKVIGMGYDVIDESDKVRNIMDKVVSDISMLDELRRALRMADEVLDIYPDETRIPDIREVHYEIKRLRNKYTDIYFDIVLDGKLFEWWKEEHDNNK